VYFTDVYNLLNILFINTDTISKNSKEQNCVDWTERLKEHLQLPQKKYDNEETHCTKAKILKNDTCIEFIRDIKAMFDHIKRLENQFRKQNLELY